MNWADERRMRELETRVQKLEGLSLLDRGGYLPEVEGTYTPEPRYVNVMFPTDLGTAEVKLFTYIDEHPEDPVQVGELVIVDAGGQIRDALVVSTHGTPSYDGYVKPLLGRLPRMSGRAFYDPGNTKDGDDS